MRNHQPFGTRCRRAFSIYNRIVCRRLAGATVRRHGAGVVTRVVTHVVTHVAKTHRAMSVATRFAYRFGATFLMGILLGVAGHATPIRLPSYATGDRLEIIEKENVRRRENGRYAGYVYREYRGLLHYVTGDNLTAQFDGMFYVLEDVSMLGNRSRSLTQSIASSILVSKSGPSTYREGAGYPRTLEFPALTGAPIEVGQKWREFGMRYVDPVLNGRLTGIRFYCEYRYDGLDLYNDEEVYSIYAQYALRYTGGDDSTGDPELAYVSGSHKARILIYADGSGRVFVRTQVDELYRFSDNREITQQGFLLTWLNDAVALDREETIRTVEQTLSDDDTRDIRVEERAEGVAISLESIHFVPDSPEILPDERDRLDILFAALSGVGTRTFLVIGHTADIGTVESQQVLSVERAQTVISGLVERGLSADRFVFTGKGGTEPIASNDDESGRAQNRRVEVIILDP